MVYNFSWRSLSCQENLTVANTEKLVEVSQQLEQLSENSTTLSYADVEFTADVLSDIAKVTRGTTKTKGAEKNVNITSYSDYVCTTDLLPNFGPGTSKRYRKPVTTGNTVISKCEKRNFRRSSDLAEAKIYLFAFLVIFDMPSANHFFRSFCSQVAMTMVLVGVLKCSFSDTWSYCIEILTKFSTA